MTIERIPSRGHQRGFSLIEIMIAVTIIVLMGGIVAVNVFPQLFSAQRDRASLDIESLSQAVRLFELRESRLPNESEWPTFLFEGSKRQPEGYLNKDQFEGGEVKDPWEQPYIYRKISSSNFEIISYGKDQQPGGEGERRGHLVEEIEGVGVRASAKTAGFSLIEIMIALAIVAILTGAFTVYYGGLTVSERLSSAARKIAGMSDCVRSEATSARRTAYLEIDFDRDRFRFRLDPPSDAVGRLIDPDHKKPMNEAEIREWIEGYDWEELPRGIHFRKLWISRDKFYDKKTVEISYSATGTLSSFILWLQAEKRGDTDGEWQSLVVNGLTGRSEVVDWAAEFPEASETDFNDVLPAEQARGEAK